MTPLGRLAAGLLLKGVLRRATGRAEPAGSPGPAAPPRRPRGATAATRPRPGADPPARHGPAFVVMMAGVSIGVPLMLLFESPVTRAIGVAGLFAFIAAGVFAIATPSFLSADDEERP